jgi:hypothetical protein
MKLPNVGNNEGNHVRFADFEEETHFMMDTQNEESIETSSITQP